MFKKFTVFQDRCAMKVGTDGVLLGAWVNVEGASSILDVGTGTGLLALMVAQRCTAMIDAVEIDEDACAQARENVAACLWKERISIRHESFQHFMEHIGYKYDLILSNPPYFRNSLRSPVPARSTARHDDKLGFEVLLSESQRLLSDRGRLGIIIPAPEIALFTELAYFCELHLLRQTLVRPARDKEYSRCLAEFGRFRPSAVEMVELLIKQGRDYSTEYRELTKEFYLNTRDTL